MPKAIPPRRFRRAHHPLLLAVLAACTGSGQAAVEQKTAATPAAPAAQQEFIGTLVYDVSADGPNKDGVELFRAGGPQRETVTWGSGGKLRLHTAGGFMEGVTVARFADSAFFVLDSARRTAKRVSVQSMNVEDAEPAMRAFIEARYGPAEVERLDEEGTYAGRRCRMHRMVKSGFLRAGATGRACLAEDIRIRPSRFHFQDGGFGRMVPLPLQYGFREGLPLMVEVNENGTIVTYRAASLTPGEPADSLFSVPADYTVEKDSAG